MPVECRRQSRKTNGRRRCVEPAGIRSTSTFPCGGCCCKELELPGGVLPLDRGFVMWKRAAEVAVEVGPAGEDPVEASIMTSTTVVDRPGGVISTIPIPLRNIRPTLRATWTGAPPPRNSRQIVISRPTVCRVSRAARLALDPEQHRGLRPANHRRSVPSATTRCRPGTSSTRCSTANTTPADAAWRTT